MNKIEKCSNSQIGRVVVHHGDVEKRIYKDEINSYLENGWKIGVSDKHRKANSETHKGKTAWNKGKSPSQETKDKISHSLTGNIPWNKGLTKETDDRIKKYSKPHTEESKKLMSERKKGRKHSDETKEKISKNRKGKYLGFRDPEIGKKISTSKLNHPVSEETRTKISLSKSGKKMPYDIKISKLEKEYHTKKKNNSFNISNPEKQLLEQLILENPGKTILTQYKDRDRYPFYCDFYIVEDDLFIELNAHWTHGGKPYDPNDLWCQEKLQDWIDKSKQSKFYEVAINTWTVRDVEKRKCAEENKLNYKTIY